MGRSPRYEVPLATVAGGAGLAGGLETNPSNAVVNGMPPLRRFTRLQTSDENSIRALGAVE